MPRSSFLWSFLIWGCVLAVGSCVRNPGVVLVSENLPGSAVAEAESPLAPDVPFVHPRVWQGLALRSEMSCPVFNVEDYRSSGAWPAPRLRASDGAFLDVLACTRFDEPDDPAVALGWVAPPALAHGAGLCHGSVILKHAFAADPDNWIYAPIEVFRSGRRGRGPGGWMPTRNGCWYAAAQLRIRQRYGLSLTDADAFGRIPDFPVTRSHPPASWPSAANSSICRTYRKTAGEESRRRSPVANRWMRP